MAIARADDEFEIRLLDVGQEQYGDCVLCRTRGVSILVDGGHLSNLEASAEHPSLLAQLVEALGTERPRVDLLVVSHAHTDHIGCLPELIIEERLSARAAILADPDLGFNRPSADGSSQFEQVISDLLHEELR